MSRNICSISSTQAIPKIMFSFKVLSHAKIGKVGS